MKELIRLEDIRLEDIKSQRSIYWFGTQTGNVYFYEIDTYVLHFANVSYLHGKSFHEVKDEVSFHDRPVSDISDSREWMIPCPFDPEFSFNLLVGEVFTEKRFSEGYKDAYTGEVVAFGSNGVWHRDKEGRLDFSRVRTFKQFSTVLLEESDADFAEYAKGIWYDFPHVFPKKYDDATVDRIMHFSQKVLVGVVDRGETEAPDTAIQMDVDEETAALLHSIR